MRTASSRPNLSNLQRGGSSMTLAAQIDHLRTLAVLDPETTILQRAIISRTPASWAYSGSRSIRR